MFDIIMIEGDEDGLGAVSNYKPIGDFNEGVQYVVHEEESYGTKIYPVIQLSERIDGSSERDYLYQNGEKLTLRGGETCAQAVYRLLSEKGIAVTISE